MTDINAVSKDTYDSMVDFVNWALEKNLNGKELSIQLDIPYLNLFYIMNIETNHHEPPQYFWEKITKMTGLFYPLSKRKEFKEVIPTYVLPLLKEHGNASISIKRFKKYGKGKIVEGLRDLGFECDVEVIHHKETDSDTVIIKKIER